MTNTETEVPPKGLFLGKLSLPVDRLMAGAVAGLAARIVDLLGLDESFRLGLGTLLMIGSVDRVEYLVHGRDGKETRLHKRLFGIAAEGMKVRELATTYQPKGSVINHYYALDRTPRRVFAPSRHHDMMRRIYDRLHLPREFATPAEPGSEVSACSLIDMDQIRVYGDQAWELLSYVRQEQEKERLRDGAPQWQ